MLEEYVSFHIVAKSRRMALFVFHEIFLMLFL